ncbi:MAG: transcription elongation factor GreA [Candidatus Gracilibacteria bacterium]|jgi:transcription elongation factor GreA|nr:transcription elongation factor GreA [Candidatus Gracilibacteria bacterium]
MTEKVKKTKTANTSIQPDDKVLLTEEGLQKLRDELEYLKDTKRDEVAKRLQEAISYGDLSENSEYEEAKNEQAFCEGRIVELEKMIKNAEIIDEKKAHKAKTVRIGTTVVIENLTKTEEIAEYTIVGSTEADPFAARISNESPIGKSLLGKKKGDIAEVKAPGGDFEFKIVDLK